MASERDEVAQGFGFEDHITLIKLMAERDLHIVTAADKAVLDAWSRLNDEEVMRIYRSGNVEQDLAAAELSRRKR